MKKVGILLSNNDIMIKSNSIVIGNNLMQNISLILNCNKGEVKEHSKLGVGINDMVNDNDELEWKKKIREGLLKDNISLNSIEFKENNVINIEIPK